MPPGFCRPARRERGAYPQRSATSEQRSWAAKEQGRLPPLFISTAQLCCLLFKNEFFPFGPARPCRSHAGAGVLSRHTVTSIGNQQLTEVPPVTCDGTNRHKRHPKPEIAHVWGYFMRQTKGTEPRMADWKHAYLGLRQPLSGLHPHKTKGNYIQPPSTHKGSLNFCSWWF